MKILQFGDLHLEKGNLDISGPALEAIVEIAERERPDLAIFTGDAVTKRGAFFPETAFIFRRAMERIATFCQRGAIAIDGNHDVLFDGSKSFVVGALAGLETTQSGTGRIEIVSGYPQDINLPGITIAAIPTFDRYRLRTSLDELEVMDKVLGVTEATYTDSGIVEAAVRGFLAGAKIEGKPLVAVYHGSIAGAKLGNEQVIRSGIDVPVRADAFSIADVVLMGHIHKAQVVDGPEGQTPMIYNGATCPLGWGEKAIEPSVVMVEVDETGFQGFERIALPVVSQMIEGRVELQADDKVSPFIRLSLFAEMAPAGSQVRITAAGPREVLSLIGNSTGDDLVETHNLRSVTIIKDPNEEKLAGRQVDRDVSIVDAVGIWSDMQVPEIDQDLRAQLVTLATEIEGQVQDERLDAKFDFDPISLQVKNFCQYGEAVLPLSEIKGATMFRGANTAGKSNLARAIPFALYKSIIAGDVMADLIRNGEKTAEVELEFESGGDRYRIKRVLKRGKDRAASSNLFFDVLEPDEKSDGTVLGEWVPAVEGTEPETQAKINDLVGPPDLFFAAAFADQNSIDALLNLRPAEMKDLLATVLHRNFQARVKIASGRRALAEVDRSKAETLIEELSRGFLDAEPAKELLSVNVKTSAEIQAELELISCDDELKADETAGVEEVAKAKAAAEGAEKRRLDLVELTTEKTRLNKAVDLLGVLRDGLPVLELAAASHDKGAEKLSQTAKNFHAARNEVDRLAPILSSAVDAVAAAKMAITSLDGLKEKKALEVDADLRVAQQKERSATRSADLVDRVPCGGEVLNGNMPGDPLVRPAVDCSTCELLGDAVKAKGTLAEVQELIETLRRKKETQAEAFGRERTGLEEERDRLDSIRADIADKADRAAAVVEAEAARHKTLTDAVARTTTSATDLAAAKARIESGAGAEDLLAQATEKVDALAGEVEDDSTIAARVAGAEARLSIVRKDLDERREKREKGEGELTKLARDRAAIEATLEKIEENALRVIELKDTSAAAEKEIVLFASYERALGRDGVPFLLLERYAIPEIQSRVNHYLEPTPWRVTIETDRASVTAGLKPGVYVYFTDERGRHPLSATSGAQSVAIGGSFRQGVADLHSSATGTVIRLAVQDEGFGAFDSENIKAAIETVRRIAERRESFIFISHIDAMESVADHIVEVFPNKETGSTITIDGAAA